VALATGPADGNDRADPIRVRMLSNWCDSRALCELFNRMTSENGYEWQFLDARGSRRRIRMVWEDDDPDYWVVMNSPPPAEESTLDPARTVVFPMEPLMWTEAMRPLWGRWASPSPLSFLQVRDHRRYRNSNDWWLGLSYAELKTSPLQDKDRVIAACVSGKYFDPGHRKRIDFLHYLDGEALDLDIYGDEGNGFRAWRSATPLHDKRSCLLPYRYYFDAENNSTPNYYTEKIVDCLLAETLCFYWGCPNLDSFFDPRAFIRLDLDDFEADLARIREAIDGDEWSQRVPFIRAEKQRILDDYQFFPTLARALDPTRRQRHWHVGARDRDVVEHCIGLRRARTFVEISARTDGPEISETIDVERRLDWSGLCLEANPARARAARGIRDCTVVIDNANDPVEGILRRNAVSPNAIDWLNLAVDSPHALLQPGGRLDPIRIRANLVTMPTASAEQRRRCVEYLADFGYETPSEPNETWADSVVVRRGRDDIFGFYHLCTINTWRDVLGEQLDQWMESGLLDATRHVFISVVGPDTDEARSILTYALGSRADFVYSSEDVTSFERPLLQYARRFCETEEPLARGVWYMHSKGVSSQHCRNPHVTDWRRFMEYFVVEHWHDCVDALTDHDTCGVNWHVEPAPHFSGNFWWATPRYLASLPANIGANHFDPEAWIGSNQPRVRSFRESGIDHYVEPYPPQTYREKTAVPSIP
jgi:hypothetical protein